LPDDHGVVEEPVQEGCDHALATAILDRLLHHATTINIKGESYRLKEKKKAGLLAAVETEKGGEQVTEPIEVAT